jgi:UDP-glucose 4-epimerase
LAEGVVKALAPSAANRTYNLVGQDDVTVLEIASTVQSLVGDVEIEHVEGRAADFGGAQVDGSRAERELGWRAETPFREGVRRYIAWHRDHEQASERARAPLTLGSSVKGAARAAPALVMSALAGLAAAGIATIGTPDDASDRASFVAVIALLMLPLALVADLDWQAGRRRTIATLLTMGVVAAVAASVLPVAAYVAHLVHVHQLAAGVLAACAVSVLLLARRVTRPARPSPSDSAV